MITKLLAAAALVAAIGLSISGTWAVMEWAFTKKKIMSVVKNQDRMRPVPHSPPPKIRWSNGYDI